MPEEFDETLGREKALTEAVLFTSAAMPVFGQRHPEDVVVVAEVFLGFLRAGSEKSAAQAEVIAHSNPFVPIAESVQPDYIVCLDDGRRLQMLRRHIESLGYTPETYRQRWGLPPDYPMTAPSYSAKRSVLAKQAGLGDRARRRVAAE